MEMIIKFYMIVPPSLEQAFSEITDPPNLPKALPAVHVTRVKRFKDIVRNRQLTPQTDDVFNKGILHFFYGGVFYHCLDKNLRDRAELPIAFLFKPSIISNFQDYYPFDTGGVAKRLDGEWKQRMNGFQDMFKVSGTGDRTPRLMVHHLFGTNEKYILGEPNSNLADKPVPLPLLYEFFLADLSDFGFDQRQCAIECQTSSSVEFKGKLDWIGFPEPYTDEVMNLFEFLEPDTPRYWQYPTPAIFNPARMVHTLNQKAYEEAIRYFVNVPNA
jgi:hypothetical protein